MAENQLIPEIEQALAGLVKLMKALRFYPKEHPSLRSSISECVAIFQPMLAHQEPPPIQVSPSGFSLGQSKIGENNPALERLSHLLAERRVNQLIFLADLLPHELLILLEGLTTPAEEIYRIGGLPIFLHQRGVKTIWLNESSLEGALHKRNQQAEETETDQQETLVEQLSATEVPNKAAVEMALREIIDRLNTELHNDDYQQQIEKLLLIVPAYFEQTSASKILRILPLLLSHSQQPERNQSQRRIAANAFERLLTEEKTSLLLEQFKRTSLTPQQYQRLQQFIVVLGIRIAPQMLAMMSKEEDHTVRKRLTILLGRMGEPLFELLCDMVRSNKWYVVRNAITLLGNLRMEEGLDILGPLANHPDQRVRRALIQALTMIGGDKSVAPLLKLTRDPKTALRRPAVKALGACRSGKAVHPLLAIAKKIDPLGRHTDIRGDAIAALGTLNQKKAIPTLLALSRRPNILHRQCIEELRAEIILTLGRLGDIKTHDYIEQWRESRHGVVRRAAELSLANLTKRHDNPTAD